MAFSKKSHNRRSLICAVLIMIGTLLSPPPASIALSELFTLTEVAKALGEAGESLSKIANGFSDLVQKGSQSYKLVSANHAVSRLTELSANLTELRASQNAMVLDMLEEYIRQPTPDNWGRVTTNLELVLKNVNELLAIVKSERSDFVLENTYFDMVSTLGQRGIIIQRLVVLPPPQSMVELAELKRVHAQYRKLAQNLSEATKQLNAYIKMLNSKK